MDDAEVRQGAMAFGEIEPVSDHPLVGDGEPDECRCGG
jgi:hypothetical protein